MYSISLFIFSLCFSGWANNDCCLICELEQHASMLRDGRGPLSPIRILSLMRNFSSQMGGGDQEDAHEFLRCIEVSYQFIVMEGSSHNVIDYLLTLVSILSCSHFCLHFALVSGLCSLLFVSFFASGGPA